MPTSVGFQRPFRGTWRVLFRELSAFGVVGLACFALDVGLFQLCYAQAGLGAVTSKLIATMISMTVAYVGHRYWSFSHRAQSGHRRQYSLFAVVNVLTLLLGLAIVALVRYPLGQESALVLQLANIGSIVVGTLVRWLCYRRWVFPAPGEVRPATSDGSDAVAPGPRAEAPA